LEDRLPKDRDLVKDRGRNGGWGSSLPSHDNGWRSNAISA